MRFSLTGPVPFFDGWLGVLELLGRTAQGWKPKCVLWRSRVPSDAKMRTLDVPR
jgi:hypothetical protein